MRKKTLKKSCSPSYLKSWQNVQRKVADIVGKIAMLANSIEEQGHFHQLFSTRGRHRRITRGSVPYSS